MDQPVPAHLPLEIPPLLTRGQGAAEEQVRAVGHVAVLGDVLDGVPAVQEPASVAVDEGDGGCARRGGVEARVVGAYLGGGVELSDVQERGARAVLEEGQVDHPASARSEDGGQRFETRRGVPTNNTKSGAGKVTFGQRPGGGWGHQAG